MAARLWKHPPLPWWTADLVYRLAGDVNAVYVLGLLAAVICFYGVWLLAREAVGEFEGLLAVLIPEGIHFYNFRSSNRPRPDAASVLGVHGTLFLSRGDARTPALGRRSHAGGCVLVEIRGLALAATLGLFLLFDPMARRA
jgi:hypothetical protein